MTLEQLNIHYSLESDYKAALETIQRLRDAAGLKAQSFTGMPHGSSAGDMVNSIVAEVVHMEERIKPLERAVKSGRAEIEAWLDTVSDIKTGAAVRLRFIHCMKWNEVAKVLGGTEDGIRKKVYKAV